jgi:nitroreductase
MLDELSSNRSARHRTTTPGRDLTPDELLSTTRAVRRRLDVDRPVEREVLEECLRLAQQAPNSRNAQPWHFVVATDREQVARIADVYQRAKAPFVGNQQTQVEAMSPGPEREAAAAKLADRIDFNEKLPRMPAFVVPCVDATTDAGDGSTPGPWGSVIQAAWSFMLAARSRGLGTVWTTITPLQPELAAIIGIPHPDVLQAALIPVAYTKGTNFRPAPRPPLETFVHWDRW